MKSKRLREKGRLEKGAFIAIPLDVLNSQAMMGLTANAKRLFVDLCGLYRFGRNGDLSPSRSVMRERGWTSHASLQRAVHELQDAGIIEQTRQGGRHRSTLFGFTWQPINDCGGKLDAPETAVSSGLWRQSPENRKAWPATRATVARKVGQSSPNVRQPLPTAGPASGPVSATTSAKVASATGTYKTLPCRQGNERARRNRWHRSSPRKSTHGVIALKSDATPLVQPY